MVFTHGLPAKIQQKLPHPIQVGWHQVEQAQFDRHQQQEIDVVSDFPHFRFRHWILRLILTEAVLRSQSQQVNQNCLNQGHLEPVKDIKSSCYCNSLKFGKQTVCLEAPVKASPPGRMC